jgi:uncharacterized membrane protein YfhO
MIVVSQGYDAGWRAEVAGQEVPLLRANGRYWALATPGGTREWALRFRPRWLPPALAIFSIGLLASLALLARPAPRSPTPGLGVRS